MVVSTLSVALFCLVFVGAAVPGIRSEADFCFVPSFISLVMEDFSVDLSRLDDSFSKPEAEKAVELCRKDVKRDIMMRATNKRKVTLILKKLHQRVEESSLSHELFINQKECVQGLMKEIEGQNSTIVAKYESHDMFTMDPGCLEAELEKQTEYL